MEDAVKTDNDQAGLESKPDLKDRLTRKERCEAIKNDPERAAKRARAKPALPSQSSMFQAVEDEAPPSTGAAV